ncbi:hypothetical protein MCAG_04179 [Micromonospora sp. ATCC 39149]|uniref:NACHT N-terminal Helical domain-containing protein n=1 Tax=Micromonospora carbonacea TaxID=47853 RepID=A0A7D6CFX2_9ACTN|nr:hypothetical protein [Micromonospora sp. ATCC 39149]EEP73852.1 hypothetical protein MCAG_04179 [Micromonospora sp. ATCC 39149]QLJ99751.1 hypothetical protein HZU44_06485 [Micromonospora carbonacea]
MAPSPYSLEGARTILSGPDDKWARSLSTLLGIGVIAAGPIGLATGSGVVLAAWGWVDQKNEVVSLLGRLVTAGLDRLGVRRLPERASVLAATHTALVYGAFFAAIRETLGPVYDQIGLTDEDKERLADRATAALAQRQLTHAFAVTQVPLPWAGCGFRVNRDTFITSLYQEIASLCIKFFQTFVVWDRAEVVSPAVPLIETMVERAVRRYDSEYKLLAADVREFEIWAMLGEHDATQAAVGDAAESLVRLEHLLVSLAGAAQHQAHEVRRVSADFNRAVLDEPLVTAGISDELPALKVPAVGDGYLSPSFRWMVMSNDARPADESWWTRTTPEQSNLDGFLAAYFSSPQSHERPLVVLGHPGSGKSMFTKVCAARLSSSNAFSAARIPLRQVPDPNAPIYQQVTAVLSKATNGRVSWPELSDASVDATRVLFIDGLDEFMQASGTSESNYLQNVVEFQRIEAVTSHPVAVIVTSRTLVADLARIPDGCLVIKLENFRPEQVTAWLNIWDCANPHLRHSELAGIPPAGSVLSYGDIARQPLLLLLLVLYGVPNGLPSMEKGSTPAQIYGGILQRFIRRELSKPTDADPVGSEEAQIHAELWRLGIAAFGMFNRGKHYIEEQILLEDLHTLDPTPRHRQITRRGAALSAARRVLGKFFFIYTSEADEGLEGRSYEFLHATFSEYLIAYFTMTELAELWNSRDRPSSQNWDDDRLYALLSHQALNSGGSAILSFIEQLHSDPENATLAGQILRILLSEAGDRWGSGRYGAYSPSSGTYMERYATYTANLMLLLLHVQSNPVRLTTLLPRSVQNNDWWARLVRVWQGYMSSEVLSAMSAEAEPDWAITRGGSNEQPVVHTEWLALSRIDAVIFNAGHGVIGNSYSIGSPDREIHALGQAARAYVDPAAFWQGRQAVGELIHAGETGGPQNYSLSLLAAHVAYSPELFSPEDAAALAPLALQEDFLSRQSWPLSLVIAQYPELAGRSDVVARIDQIPVARPEFAALLAGALIWGDDWPAAARVIARATDGLRGAAMALRPWIDGMSGLVDERRQVLVVAGHLVMKQGLLLEEEGDQIEA